MFREVIKHDVDNFNLDMTYIINFSTTSIVSIY